MRPAQSTRLRLVAANDGLCAFHDPTEGGRCEVQVYDAAHQKLLGEISYIRAASEGGPRYDPAQPDEDRHSFRNLLILCPNHHRLVDSETGVLRYPPETLEKWKHRSEARDKEPPKPSTPETTEQIRDSEERSPSSLTGDSSGARDPNDPERREVVSTGSKLPVRLLIALALLVAIALAANSLLSPDQEPPTIQVDVAADQDCHIVSWQVDRAESVSLVRGADIDEVEPVGEVRICESDSESTVLLAKGSGGSQARTLLAPDHSPAPAIRTDPMQCAINVCNSAENAIGVVGSSFGREEAVSISIFGPSDIDGGIIETLTATSDSSGKVEIPSAFWWTPDSDLGVYSVVAEGGTSGEKATGFFTLFLPGLTLESISSVIVCDGEKTDLATIGDLLPEERVRVVGPRSEQSLDSADGFILVTWSCEPGSAEGRVDLVFQALDSGREIKYSFDQVAG